MSIYTEVSIVGDSINRGNRITTFEVTFPRIILAEFNTHRMLSRNFSSSRAIPLASMITTTEEEFYEPSKWGANKSGMQSTDYIDNQEAAYELWEDAFYSAKSSVEQLGALGVHKQWCNRLLEPFQYVKGICTATDYDNFFWLRCDEDAQPEIKVLADLMYSAYNKSTPVELVDGEWHIPYFELSRQHNRYYCPLTEEYFKLEDALSISVSLCAQRSYRKQDASPERAERLAKLLLEGSKPHCSPFEHQATPIHGGYEQKGVTHQLPSGLYCSGNLVGWSQYRHHLSTPDSCNFREIHLEPSHLDN